ncbi:MAG: NAD(P)-dependent oxidoreductase [Prevotella sp.]|nr:NAD(P)-dependent oxidoreductase [Prevotella sp.]
MKKILVTGASGFIGSFIVEEALAKGMEVWAGIRKSSSRQFLQDKRINFIELNLNSPTELRKQLSDISFDYVVHAAGVTKCLNKADFYRVNTEGTRNLVTTLIELKMPIERFVFLSSLSIFGAIREKQPYEPIQETDTPHPNTVYGKSKLEAEKAIRELAGTDFPYVILRPTGVYGPRERDYFLMAQSIKGHSDFSVGYKRQDITFVYVKDVVQAVFLALKGRESRVEGRESVTNGRAYFLSDGEVYQSSTFSDLIIKEMGNPWCLRIKAPIWVLRIVTACGEWLSHFTGKISALNNDKYHILKQRNWQCNIQPAIEELGYNPEYNLERGVKETIAWYKEQKWL